MDIGDGKSAGRSVFPIQGKDISPVLGWLGRVFDSPISFKDCLVLLGSVKKGR